MYGNVVTNKQLKDLMESGCLSIDPFEQNNLKAAAYTLTPGRVLRRGDDGEYEVVHTFSNKKNSFKISADEYIVIEPKQIVRIKTSGLIGTFITASTNIENGLLVVAGQIDSNYGVNNERLRFGVRNLLSLPNTITAATRLVHLQLVDMRGSAAEPVRLSRDAQAVWNDRRATENWDEAHGPNYSAAMD